MLHFWKQTEAYAHEHLPQPDLLCTVVLFFWQAACRKKPSGRSLWNPVLFYKIVNFMLASDFHRSAALRTDTVPVKTSLIVSLTRRILKRTAFENICGPEHRVLTRRSYTPQVNCGYSSGAASVLPRSAEVEHFISKMLQ